MYFINISRLIWFSQHFAFEMLIFKLCAISVLREKCSFSLHLDWYPAH